MSTHLHGQQSLLDVEDRHPVLPGDDGWSRHGFGTADVDEGESLGPVDWNLLSADEAMVEWADLDAWIEWLRLTYGLPPTVVPPLWHRHDELVWELSALHTHWLNAYHRDGTPSGPIGWHRDFADARHRLREWVALAGCRLDRDRPTRTATWPGEAQRESRGEVEILDRRADFIEFVTADVTARRHTTEPGGFG